MALLRPRLSSAISRVVSKLVKRLCALEGQALCEAVANTTATLEPHPLEITVYKLVQQLKLRDAAKQKAAARVLEVLGPVAAPQLVADLYDSKDTAFRLRLLDVMICIGPAARFTTVPAFIQIMIDQPEQVLIDKGLEALRKLGPVDRKAAPPKTERPSPGALEE
jgi:hypothetical protein